MGPKEKTEEAIAAEHTCINTGTTVDGRPAPPCPACSSPPDRYIGGGHPWADFLHHRARALRWLRDVMGETAVQTCRTMQLDPVEVRRILLHVDAHPELYSGSPSESVTEPEKQR